MKLQATNTKTAAALDKMRGGLKKWLKFRQINDAVADGTREAKIPSYIAAQRLPRVRDWALEQRMADDMHALLSEVFDSKDLPDPRINKNPQAAVQLAKIVVSGRLPEEAQVHSEQGVIWLWPAVALAGIVAATLIYKIRSDADTALEKERIECIKSGACTDYGFWIKVGGMAVVAWFAWEKLGLKKRFAG